jgi:hypothetical protein
MTRGMNMGNRKLTIAGLKRVANLAKVRRSSEVTEAPVELLSAVRLAFDSVMSDTPLSDVGLS